MNGSVLMKRRALWILSALMIILLAASAGESGDPPAMALCLKQVFSKDKTFRPRKRFEPGTQRGGVFVVRRGDGRVQFNDFHA